MKTILVFEWDFETYGQRLYDPQIQDPEPNVFPISERLCHPLIRVFNVIINHPCLSSRQEALRGRSERGIMVETGFGLAIAIVVFIGTLVIAVVTAVFIAAIVFLVLAILVGFLLRISILEALKIITLQNRKKSE